MPQPEKTISAWRLRARRPPVGGGQHGADQLDTLPDFVGQCIRIDQRITGIIEKEDGFHTFAADYLVPNGKITVHAAGRFTEDARID